MVFFWLLILKKLQYVGIFSTVTYKKIAICWYFLFWLSVQKKCSILVSFRVLFSSKIAIRWYFFLLLSIKKCRIVGIFFDSSRPYTNIIYLQTLFFSLLLKYINFNQERSIQHDKHSNSQIYETYRRFKRII